MMKNGVRCEDVGMTHEILPGVEMMDEQKCLYMDTYRGETTGGPVTYNNHVLHCTSVGWLLCIRGDLSPSLLTMLLSSLLL